VVIPGVPGHHWAGRDVLAARVGNWTKKMTPALSHQLPGRARLGQVGIPARHGDGVWARQHLGGMAALARYYQALARTNASAAARLVSAFRMTSVPPTSIRSHSRHQSELEGRTRLRYGFMSPPLRHRMLASTEPCGHGCGTFLAIVFRQHLRRSRRSSGFRRRHPAAAIPPTGPATTGGPSPGRWSTKASRLAEVNIPAERLVFQRR
jgi:hypothetical protein